MKFPSIFFLLVAAIFLISCEENKSELAQEPIDKIKKFSSEFDTLGISKEVFQNLLKEGDHIDIMFHNLPLSMNQDGNSALYQDLQFISSRPFNSMGTYCDPLARKIYLSKGEIIMEGDLYYGPECYFQIFIKDGKELYGNHLTPKGVAFVAQLLQQAEAAKPNQ